METNVGEIDSYARIVLGAVLGVASLAILGEAIPAPLLLSPLLGAVSLVLIITAATNKCGVYSVLDVNTAQ